MYRLPMRHDHALERQLEQRAERGHDSLLVPRRRPNAQLTAGCGQRVRKHESALLRQPERRLAALASVVQGDEPSRKLAARLDPPQVRLGDVPTEVEPWPEGGDSIAPREHVDVSYMIRLENDGRCRRMRVEPLPDVGR